MTLPQTLNCAIFWCCQPSHHCTKTSFTALVHWDDNYDNITDNCYQLSYEIRSQENFQVIWIIAQFLLTAKLINTLVVRLTCIFLLCLVLSLPSLKVCTDLYIAKQKNYAIFASNFYFLYDKV